MSESKLVSARVDELFKAGAHYGSTRSRRHPSAKPFIYGAKNRVQIIDLEKTSEQIERAATALRELGSQGKTVLVVGSKKEAVGILESITALAALPTVTERWLGGTLTNWNEIKRRIARMHELKEQRAGSELDKYTKKERLAIDREIAHLERYLSGIATLTERPAALLVVDPRHEAIAVTEAQSLGIPVIAIANVDCDLRAIRYPIVSNDAAPAAIRYILDILIAAYRDGLQAHRTAAEQVESNPNEQVPLEVYTEAQ